jgi:hypothetical protein
VSLACCFELGSITVGGCLSMFHELGSNEFLMEDQQAISVGCHDFL